MLTRQIRFDMSRDRESESFFQTKLRRENTVVEKFYSKKKHDAAKL